MGAPVSIVDAQSGLPRFLGGVVVSDSFTRPDNTTAYASGDLVANSATAGSVAALTFSGAAVMNGGSFRIKRVRLTKDDDDVTNASFRLHLFDSDPVATAPEGGDNAAIQLNGALSSYLGSFALDMTATGIDIHNDGNAADGVPINGVDIVVSLSSGKAIYGLLEARGVYTPAAEEVFTAYVEIVND